MGASAPLIAALELAADAVDQLAKATGIELVPACVAAVRSALSRFGGTAKTTGAGGGDVAIAAIPRSADSTAAARAIIQAGCRPLDIAVEPAGVDTRPTSQ